MHSQVKVLAKAIIRIIPIIWEKLLTLRVVEFILYSASKLFSTLLECGQIVVRVIFRKK